MTTKVSVWLAQNEGREKTATSSLDPLEWMGSSRGCRVRGL